MLLLYFSSLLSLSPSSCTDSQNARKRCSRSACVSAPSLLHSLSFSHTRLPPPHSPSRSPTSLLTWLYYVVLQLLNGVSNEYAWRKGSSYSNPICLCVCPPLAPSLYSSEWPADPDLVILRLQEGWRMEYYVCIWWRHASAWPSGALWVSSNHWFYGIVESMRLFQIHELNVKCKAWAIWVIFLSFRERNTLSFRCFRPNSLNNPIATTKTKVLILFQYLGRCLAVFCLYRQLPF